MGRSLRFQNLIVHERFAGAKSLYCVDLTRQLFGNTVTPPSTIGEGSESALLVRDSAAAASETPAADAASQKNKPPPSQAAAFKMERIRFSSPIFTFQAAPNEPGKIHCFPFADRKMLWSDHLGRPFLFDAETRQMDIMPCLHKPKSMPLSLFVPNADADNDYDLDHPPGSSLFVMERIPRPEEVSGSAQGDGQFEALVYCKPTVYSYTKSWQWQLLPPPPYVRQLKHCNSRSQPEISSYAVVSSRGDLHVCISVDGVGTYCLDTARHTWSQVGKWTLPFRGKAEYVPELNLWFGLSADSGHLAAADLSAMDSQPRLVEAWKEHYLPVPEEWKECKDPKIVNLGTGKFCIARFFRTTTRNSGEVSSNEDFAVLTGVEVVSLLHGPNSKGSNGKVELRMIRHKSKRVNDTTIEFF